MNDINLATLDLNLLVALDALLRERSVTRAARRCGVGQSAMSHSLGRLRALIGDALLVRDGRQMVPTPRGAALQGPLAALLGDVRRLLSHGEDFDPATSTRRFRLVCPDLVAAALPALLEVIGREAPGVDLAVRAPGGAMADALRTGGDELGLGPPPRDGAGLMQRVAGAVGWTVLMRAGHPAAADWGLETWLRWPHVVVGTGDGAPGFVDDALAATGKRRRIGLVAPGFLVAPLVVARTDALFTAPAPFVAALADALGLVQRPPPVALPRVPVVIAWPERLHGDPGHRWLRERVAAVVAAVIDHHHER